MEITSPTAFPCPHCGSTVPSPGTQDLVACAKCGRVVRDPASKISPPAADTNEWSFTSQLAPPMLSPSTHRWARSATMVGLIYAIGGIFVFYLWLLVLWWFGLIIAFLGVWVLNQRELGRKCLLAAGMASAILSTLIVLFALFLFEHDPGRYPIMICGSLNAVYFLKLAHHLGLESTKAEMFR